jgi:hypothetical protein
LLTPITCSHASLYCSDQYLIEALFDESMHTGGGSKKGAKARQNDKKALKKSVKRVKKEMDKANKMTVGASFRQSLALLM